MGFRPGTVGRRHLLMRALVIRLKQVEHVSNERNVLAAVAGHPFITTMIASFQDGDSLYMLVSHKVNHVSAWRMLSTSQLVAGLLPWR